MIKDVEYEFEDGISESNDDNFDDDAEVNEIGNNFIHDLSDDENVIDDKEHQQNSDNASDDWVTKQLRNNSSQQSVSMNANIATLNGRDDGENTFENICEILLKSNDIFDNLCELSKCQKIKEKIEHLSNNLRSAIASLKLNRSKFLNFHYIISY